MVESKRVEVREEVLVEPVDEVAVVAGVGKMERVERERFRAVYPRRADPEGVVGSGHGEEV